METKLAVRDVMTRTVVTATPDMSAAEAGKKMVANRVGNIIMGNQSASSLKVIWSRK
jgi:CBS domain-containing protein